MAVARPISQPTTTKVQFAPSIVNEGFSPVVEFATASSNNNKNDSSSNDSSSSTTAKLQKTSSRLAFFGSESSPTTPTFQMSNGIIGRSMSAGANSTAAAVGSGSGGGSGMAAELASILDRRQRTGIPGGSAACREVAAYLLDHAHHANVPPTMLALVQHEAFHSADPTLCARDPKAKIGSIQAFVAHSMVADEQPLATLRRIDVDDVHRLAIFDIRLCNTDRHGGNILLHEAPSSPDFDELDRDLDDFVKIPRNSVAKSLSSNVVVKSQSSSFDSAGDAFVTLASSTTRRNRLSVDSNDEQRDDSDSDDDFDRRHGAVVGRLDESLESIDEAEQDVDDDERRFVGRSPSTSPSYRPSSLTSTSTTTNKAPLPPLHLTPIDHGYTLPSNLEEVHYL